MRKGEEDDDDEETEEEEDEDVASCLLTPYRQLATPKKKELY